MRATSTILCPKIDYTMDENKRICLNAEPLKTTFPVFSTRQTFNIPTQLTREYIERHSLSKVDVEKILGKICLYELPAFALSLGLGTNQVTNITCATSKAGGQYDISVTDKNSLYRLVWQHLEKKYNLQNNVPDKLVCPFDDHRPPLPVHFVDKNVLQLLSSRVVFQRWKWVLTPEATSNMSEEQFSKTSLVPRVVNLTGKSAFEQKGTDIFKHDEINIGKWKNMLWIPLTFYKGYLQLMHIIEKQDVFIGPLIEKPFEFLLGSNVYQTTGESILLQTIKGHEQLCQFTEDVLFQSKFSENLYNI